MPGRSADIRPRYGFWCGLRFLTNALRTESCKVLIRQMFRLAFDDISDNYQREHRISGLIQPAAHRFSLMATNKRLGRLALHAGLFYRNTRYFILSKGYKNSVPLTAFTSTAITKDDFVRTRNIRCIKSEKLFFQAT